MKALVLDDSSLRRTAIRKILEEIGCDVTEAAGALRRFGVSGTSTLADTKAI